MFQSVATQRETDVLRVLSGRLKQDPLWSCWKQSIPCERKDFSQIIADFDYL